MRIDVLGLGKSILEYKNNGCQTIGVNDIYRYHKTDYVLCVDYPKRFNEERLNFIKGSTPKKFYSQLVTNGKRQGWDFMINFEKIELTSKLDLSNRNKISHSNNSAFVATVLAFHLGATEIVLCGVDFVGHKHLSQQRMLQRAMNDFKKLKEELEKKDVIISVSSKFSKLHGVLPLYI